MIIGGRREVLTHACLFVTAVTLLLISINSLLIIVVSQWEDDKLIKTGCWTNALEPLLEEEEDEEEEDDHVW